MHCKSHDVECMHLLKKVDPRGLRPGEGRRDRRGGRAPPLDGAALPAAAPLQGRLRERRPALLLLARGPPDADLRFRTRFFVPENVGKLCQEE